jgi:hypothetical protein
MHRLLCAPDQPLRLGFNFLLKDGAVVGGMIDADYPGVRYAMETCYDESLARLGAGHLVTLLTVREAFACGAPALNFFGGYDYYKGKWAARLLGTRTLQVFRVGSPHWLKARLGDLRRWLEERRELKEAGRFNPVKREVEQQEPGRAAAAKEGGAPVGLPSLEAERALAARILGTLAAEDVVLERLEGAALRAALPFKSPAPGRKG